MSNTRTEPNLQRSSDPITGKPGEALAMEIAARLASGTAHDLNNILIVIKGYAEIALASASQDQALTEHLHKIISGADRAAALTNQLSLFGRAQRLLCHPLPVDQLLLHALPSALAVLKDGFVLDIHCPAELPLAIADPGLVGIALAAMVDAGADATPRGGRLRIQAALFSGSQAPGGSPALPAGVPELGPGASMLAISVEDSGVSLSREICDRLFEPYFAPKQAKRGRGLELACAHGIARQHGGWIEAGPSETGGTVLCLVLPAHPPQSPKETPDETGAQPIRGGTEALLFVSSDGALIERVSEPLRNLGYRLSIAENETAAGEVWTKRGGRFDLVLQDVNTAISGVLAGWTDPAVRGSIRKLIIAGSRFFIGPIGRSSSTPVDLAFLPANIRFDSLARTLRSLLEHGRRPAGPSR